MRAPRIVTVTEFELGVCSSVLSSVLRHGIAMVAWPERRSVAPSGTMDKGSGTKSMESQESMLLRL